MATVMQIDSSLNIELLSTKHTEEPALNLNDQVEDALSINDDDQVNTEGGTEEFFSLLLGITPDGTSLDQIVLKKNGSLGAKKLEEQAINPSFNNSEEVDDTFIINDEDQVDTLDGLELLFVNLIGLTNEGQPLDKIIMTRNTINTPGQIIEGGL
jgi:hypothetical protein